MFRWERLTEHTNDTHGDHRKNIYAAHEGKAQRGRSKVYTINYSLPLLAGERATSLLEIIDNMTFGVNEFA